MTARNEIRYAAQFLDFYLKDSLSTSENVAAHLLPSLTSKHHKATEFLTDSELEWVLNSLTNILAVHEVRIVEMYFIMARYTGRKLWSIIGNFSAPGHLDQFNRRSDGRWVELRSAKDGWQPLSPHFDEFFDRYLRYLNIDPLHPLPPTPIFPRDDTIFFNPITLSRLIVSIGGILAEDAARSDDPEISSASEKFRGLTAKLVSGKPASK